ncbi:MAG: ATP-binding protein [Pseudomonadota bacterium]
MDMKTKDFEAPLAKPRRRQRRAYRAGVALVGIAALAILAAASAGDILTTREGLLLGGFLLVAMAGSILIASPPQAIQPIENLEEVRRLQRFGLLLNSLPQPVMLLDGSDHVETANSAATKVFGPHVEGTHVAGLVRAPQALDILREVRHTKVAKETEFTLAGSPGLSALFYASPLDFDEADDDARLVVMIRDRTEQKKLERMRTDFIANAGHELRTPLAAILGFIETLQGHARDDPEAQERFLRIMQQQTERMLRLVQDLVSLSALELNERRLPEDKVDLFEVATVVSEMIGPVASAAGGTVAEVQGDIGYLLTGDRDQLIQVVQNLTDNALKYGIGSTESGAKVKISVGRGPHTCFKKADRSGDSPEQIAVRAGCAAQDLVFVCVCDQGDGIEKTDLPRVTERFYRIDVERSRAKGGTGLGLAIVKHIVGRHRGGILVESSPQEGAAFTCYFPPYTQEVI